MSWADEIQLGQEIYKFNIFKGFNHLFYLKQFFEWFVLSFFKIFKAKEPGTHYYELKWNDREQVKVVYLAATNLI